MATNYRSEPFAAVHETMEALHAIGAIDKQTMRISMTPACFTLEQPIIPDEICALRSGS